MDIVVARAVHRTSVAVRLNENITSRLPIRFTPKRDDYHKLSSYAKSLKA